jgi:RNA polymerase sigma factor (sigma-70 family)
VADLPEIVSDERPDDRGALLAALSTLSPRQRAVLVLRYFDDCTEAATAEALGISLGAVKSRARDGLARLRRVAPGFLDEDPVPAAVPSGDTS